MILLILVIVIWLAIIYSLRQQSNFNNWVDAHYTAYVVLLMFFSVMLGVIVGVVT